MMMLAAGAAYVYNLMIGDGVEPDNTTYRHLVIIYALCKDVRLSRHFYSCAINRKLSPIDFDYFYSSDRVQWFRQKNTLNNHDAKTKYGRRKHFEIVNNDDSRSSRDIVFGPCGLFSTLRWHEWDLMYQAVLTTGI